MHMQKEEQILFPYIDALEKANERTWLCRASLLPNGEEPDSRHDERA